MPWVVTCDREQIAFLFDITDPLGIYLNTEHLQAAARTFLEQHEKTCSGKHLVIPCIDPYEMNGV